MDNQNQSKFSQGISTSIGILIIIVFAVLVGGILVWQGQKIKKEEVKTPEIKLPEKIKDECNVVPGEGIVSETELINYPCEQNLNCEWRGLGGKIIGHYACCPKDLKIPQDETERPYLQRCFIMID